MRDRHMLVTLASLAVLAGALACNEKKEAAPATAATATTEGPAAPKASQAVADMQPAQATGLATPGQSAALGKPAPDFTLTDVDGDRYTLSDLKGKTVVLQWFNPDCPFIEYAHTKGPLADLAKKTTSETVAWLTINSNAKGKQGYGLERNKRARGEYGIDHPLLLDPTGAVGKAYGAEKTPHMFVVNSEGVLVYRGGLDNAPIGTVDPERPRYEDSEEGAVVNYITGALQDIAAERALRLADTPAYGCSVKYQG